MSSRLIRFPRSDYLRAGALVVVFAAIAVLPSVADAHRAHAPYGSAHSGALTWRFPPDGMRTVRPGASVTLPRAATEVDVWLVRHGHAVYRYRQCAERRPDYSGRQWYFARSCARGRAVAGYVGINREAFSFTRHARIRVYYWYS